MRAESPITRSRRIFIVSGYVVLAVAFMLLGIMPYVRGMSAVQTQIGTAQRDIDSRLSARKTLDQVEKQLRLIRLQVRDFDRLLPDSQNVGDFMEKLSHERDDAGMKDSTVHSLPVITLNRCQQRPIEITGTCTYSQFDEFLKRLEKLDRKSSVSHLSVEADTAMTGKVNVSLQLSIYNTKPAN